MPGNSFGHSFRITTWGESHGKALGVVVDGVPAGLELSEADVQKDLDRRRPGQSEVSTPRSESDSVEILSGVLDGVTTGMPVSMLVWNKNAKSSAYDYIKDIPRPGHADQSYSDKYGIRDHRGGGRSSGRETIGRVAGGALARKLLSMSGIEVFAHVIELGGVKARPLSFNDIRTNVDSNVVRCADPEAAEKMLEQVNAARLEGDSIGGIVEIIATGVPAGLGEPVFGKLDADLACAMMGIGAVKGVELGAGFECSNMKGSQMNDPFMLEEGQVVPASNNAGGITGGISTGMPVICRIAVKPTPSISKTQKSVDTASMNEIDVEIHGRHDPTIPPRMVPVAESMMALVLMDHMLRSGLIGPDSLLK